MKEQSPCCGNVTLSTRQKKDEYKKAAIIGASEEALHTIFMARKHGVYVIALDGNAEAAGLLAADKGLVVDISDKKAVIEALEKEKPDFVLTAPIGRYLTTVGAVNDALSLPGISEQMAVLCTDKYRFHQKLEQRGLRPCNCYRVGVDDAGETVVAGNGKVYGKGHLNIQEAYDLPLEFPAIIKPRYGSGSRGIRFLESRAQAIAAAKSLTRDEFVLEECVAGEEYGLDGSVIDGNFFLILLRKKENTPLPARQAVGYYSVQPADPFWAQVKDYMKEVISCLNLQECLLHADLIRGEKGPFVIELSARPSGHNLHNLFTPLCTGIDMAEEYVKYRLGQPYCFKPKGTKNMLIHYFDMEGRVDNVPGIEEAKRAAEGKVVEWKCTIQPGEELPPVSDGHSLMGRGFFILEEAETEGILNLKEKAEKIKQLFFQQ